MEINVNPKFQFLYNDELDTLREIIFYGGRGSGKTYALTQFLTYKAITEKCRNIKKKKKKNENKK